MEEEAGWLQPDWSLLDRDCLRVVFELAGGRVAAICSIICRNWKEASDSDGLWHALSVKELGLHSLPKGYAGNWRAAYTRRRRIQLNWATGRYGTEFHSVEFVGASGNSVCGIHINEDKLVTAHSQWSVTPTMGHVHVTDVNTGSSLHQLMHFEGKLVDAMDGCGELVAVADSEGALTVWNIDTAEKVCETAIRPHWGRTLVMAMSKNYVATAHSAPDRGCRMAVWRLVNEQVDDRVVVRLEPLANQITAHDSGQSRRVPYLRAGDDTVECACIRGDNSMHVWDLLGMHRILELAPPDPKPGAPYEQERVLQVALNSKYLVVRTTDQRLHVYNKLTCAPMNVFNLKPFARLHGSDPAACQWIRIHMHNNYAIVTAPSLKGHETFGAYNAGIQVLNLDDSTTCLNEVIPTEHMREAATIVQMHAATVHCIASDEARVVLAVNGSKLCVLNFAKG